MPTKEKIPSELTGPHEPKVQPQCQAEGYHQGEVKQCPSCDHWICQNHMSTGSQCDFCDPGAQDD